mgnify:CR=1 FL=1
MSKVTNAGAIDVDALEAASLANGRSGEIVAASLSGNDYDNTFTNYGSIEITTSANIDLKAFTQDFYHRLCSGQLSKVLETLKYLKHETF